MKLRDIFEDGFTDPKSNAIYCEKIADDYAIEFAEWLTETRLYNEEVYSMNNTKELLEIFKKEKGL